MSNTVCDIKEKRFHCHNIAFGDKEHYNKQCNNSEWVTVYVYL